MTKEDTKGLELEWGNPDLLIDFVKDIGERKGLGRLFANGILPAAKQIGKEAETLAVQVKGLDFPAHDPRAFFGWAISYATGPRGSCHTHGLAGYVPQGLLIPEMGINKEVDRHQMEGNEKVAAVTQDLSALDDALVCCNFQHFGGLTVTDILESLNAITGWEMDIDELVDTGKRISTLKRLVNINYGIDRDDDTLPKISFQSATKAPQDAEPWGGRVGKIPEPFEQALDRYYELRGWDREGRPTEETLTKLGLAEYVG